MLTAGRRDSFAAVAQPFAFTAPFNLGKTRIASVLSIRLTHNHHYDILYPYKKQIHCAVHGPQVFFLFQYKIQG